MNKSCYVILRCDEKRREEGEFDEEEGEEEA